MGTRDITHEALAKALSEGAALTDEQRSVLLGAVADDKAWQREVDRLLAENKRLRDALSLIASGEPGLNLCIRTAKRALEHGSAHQDVCNYPDCSCPFDAPADPNWCACGYPKLPNAQHEAPL